VKEKATPWITLLKKKQVWTLIAVKFLTDGPWFFLIFWLPKYLNDARGFNLKEIGAVAWIPYACAGIGSLAGGWIFSRLVGKLGLDRARKTSRLISGILFPLAWAITSLPFVVEHYVKRKVHAERFGDRQRFEMKRITVEVGVAGPRVDKERFLVEIACRFKR